MAALELLQHPVPPNVLGLRFVEQVSRAQHRVHVAAFRHVQYPRHHLQPRPGEALLLFALESREAPAEMPVRGVQQGQGHVTLSGSVAHSITNCALNTRSPVGTA